MASKRQRTGDESKSISTLPTQSWSQLPSILRQELSRLVPGSIAGAGRYEAKLAREYRSKLCGPDRAPQVRQRRLGTSSADAKGISPLICPHHPLVPPMQFNGPSNPPCCLPLKLESPADWEQVFQLTKFGMTHVVMDSRNTRRALFPARNEVWYKRLVDLYYSNPSSIDTVEFVGDVVSNYRGGEFRNDDWKTLAIYQRNPENNVMTAAWASASLRPNYTMPIDPEWYIASDDEDKDVESQIIKHIHDEYWKGLRGTKGIDYLITVAAMATLYGRDNLAKSLSNEADMLKSLWAAGYFEPSDEDSGEDYSDGDEDEDEAAPGDQ